MSTKEVVVTRAGLEALEQELDHLKIVRRKDVAEKIKVSRGYGDLSEKRGRGLGCRQRGARPKGRKEEAPQAPFRQH